MPVVQAGDESLELPIVLDGRLGLFHPRNELEVTCVPVQAVRREIEVGEAIACLGPDQGEAESFLLCAELGLVGSHELFGSPASRIALLGKRSLLDESTPIVARAQRHQVGILFHLVGIEVAVMDGRA